MHLLGWDQGHQPPRESIRPVDGHAGSSLRPWNIFWTPVGHIDRVDGSSVPIHGIGRSHTTFLKRRTSADEMIHELNELLHPRRVGEGPEASLARSDRGRMNKLSPADQPDVLWIDPVGPIPVHYEDDPRFDDERGAWSKARRKAQALHSAEELLQGVTDDEWRVRVEAVDRLAARWHDDRRTLPALLQLAEHDPVWQVRDRAMMRLVDFDRDAVVPIARRG
jgi:HEAT repeats